MDWPIVDTAPADELGIAPAVPAYLRRYYWWTYIHPWAVKFFDRLWLINLIVLTNYHRLRDVALKAIAPATKGRLVQIACCYGDLTPKLADDAAREGGRLDVIDVLPIQLENLKRKLHDPGAVRLLNMDAAALALPSGGYDAAMLFLLLHEVPPAIRAQVLAETFRVVKPGGTVVMVDFAKPYWWNPFRYVWAVFLWVFEPFALDLWRRDIATMLPESERGATLTRSRLFGGLFQTVVAVKSDGAAKVA